MKGLIIVRGVQVVSIIGFFVVLYDIDFNNFIEGIKSIGIITFLAPLMTATAMQLIINEQTGKSEEL